MIAQRIKSAVACTIEGKLEAPITRAPLCDIDASLSRLGNGDIEGRVVINPTLPIEVAEHEAELLYA